MSRGPAAERRMYAVLATALLAACAVSALVERTHFFVRGSFTDVAGQLLPPWVLTPMALSLLLWGALRFRRIRAWVWLTLASALVLAVLLWPSVLVGYVSLFSGWVPGK